MTARSFQKVWAETFANYPDRPVAIVGAVSTFLGDHALLPQDGARYMMAGTYLMLPRSIGSIHVPPGSGTDPFALPDFNPAFLEDEADLSPSVLLYKRNREILRRMPSYRGELGILHPKFPQGSDARCLGYDEAEELVTSGKQAELKDIVYTAKDDEAIEQWVRESVQTTWHSLGTVPMKPREAGGVVDQKLHVYGTKGLAVADLSVSAARQGRTPGHSTLTTLLPYRSAQTTSAATRTLSRSWSARRLRCSSARSSASPCSEVLLLSYATPFCTTRSPYLAISPV